MAFNDLINSLQNVFSHVETNDKEILDWIDCIYKEVKMDISLRNNR